MDSDEFRLRQGEAIVTALTQQGYITSQFENKLQWQVTQPNDNWWLLLAFLPRPVAQWRLLPATYNSTQTAIYSIIEATIRKADANANGGRR